MNVINQRDEQIKAFEDERKDLAAFMSISYNSSNETIAPSTSKQTETVQSKSFTKHSFQKKKENSKKPNFFGIKSAFKRRSRRLFVSKSKRINLDVKSSSSETVLRRKNSMKGVNKKFKVNNLFKIKMFYKKRFFSVTCPFSNLKIRKNQSLIFQINI